MYTFISLFKNIGSKIVADYSLNNRFKTSAIKCQSLSLTTVSFNFQRYIHMHL